MNKFDYRRNAVCCFHINNTKTESKLIRDIQPKKSPRKEKEERRLDLMTFNNETSLVKVEEKLFAGDTKIFIRSRYHVIEALRVARGVSKLGFFMNNNCQSVSDV